MEYLPLSHGATTFAESAPQRLVEEEGKYKGKRQDVQGNVAQELLRQEVEKVDACLRRLRGLRGTETVHFSAPRLLEADEEEEEQEEQEQEGASIDAFEAHLADLGSTKRRLQYAKERHAVSVSRLAELEMLLDRSDMQHKSSLQNLGELVAKAKVLARRCQKIRELLPVSAVSDHAKSLYDLGDLEFRQVKKRYIPKKTIALWVRSARLGYQTAIGACYYFGCEEFTKDTVLAVNHLRASAEEGDRAAKFWMAHCYYTGTGGLRRDMSEALRWHELACQHETSFHPSRQDSPFIHRKEVSARHAEGG